MPFKFVQSIFLPHNSRSVGARCIARMTKYHVATENAANPMMRYVIIIIFAVVICFCFAGRMRNVSCISGRLSQIYSKTVCSNKESIEINIKKHFALSLCCRAVRLADWRFEADTHLFRAGCPFEFPCPFPCPAIRAWSVHGEALVR